VERFVLQPARVRGDRVNPLKAEDPVELDWNGLVELVGGSESPTALMTLRRLKEADYVGVRSLGGNKTNFLISTPGGSGRIGFITKKNPTFPAEVQQVFQVVEAAYESNISEAEAS
jgi:hypothetical protein